MLKAPLPPEEHDLLTDQSAYARPSDDFGKIGEAADPIAQLEVFHEMLIKRRRYLVNDVITYPVVYITRAQELCDIQRLLEGVDAALKSEQKLSELSSSVLKSV